MGLNTNRKEKQYKEVGILLLYMAFLIIIMYFHEPWYDEANAWLVAKDASIKELFSVITHYEGHPPLWFLILMPIAKSGIDYELGLKAVSFLFASGAMGLVIFKAPFKREIRFLIPFTYFFFYQFGVISRPYSAMMLGFVLCAMFYKERNEKPWRFVMSMAFLCALSSYGIVICGAISILWVIELWNRKNIIVFLKGFIKEKSFPALVFLFLLALGCIWCIVPASDAYAVNDGLGRMGSTFGRILYTFFVAPADATIYTSQSYYSVSYDFTDISLIIGLIVGLMVNVFMVLWGYRHRKLSLLLVPYAFFGIFSSAVYLYAHHIGIITMFLLFYFWCCYDDMPQQLRKIRWAEKVIREEKDRKTLHLIEKILGILMIVIPVYWTFSASIHEIQYSYGRGRDIAELIKENHMEEFNIMSEWTTFQKADGSVAEYTELLIATPVLPYFEQNIMFNYNMGKDNKRYITHQLVDNKENLDHWRKFIPDLLIGHPDLSYVYDGEAVMYDFALIKESPCNRIWKDRVFEQNCEIYLRRDHLKEYPQFKDLKQIPDKLIRDKYKN